MRRKVKSHALGIRIFWCAQRTIIFGNAFQYEPSTGHLSTVPEFGGVLIGQLDKYLSQADVQAAIWELGEFLKQSDLLI
jgi:hypothetical protein